MVFALRCVESAREEGVGAGVAWAGPSSGSRSEEIFFFKFLFGIKRIVLDVFLSVLYYKAEILEGWQEKWF